MSSPGAVQSIGVYRRMTWTRLRRGRLPLVAMVLLALPILGTVLLAFTGRWGRDLFDNVLEIHLRFLVLFLPALAMSGAVAEEVEGKTYTFLFVRPAPRFAMPLGKYVAVTLPLALLFAASVTVSFVIALLIPPAGPSELVENLGGLLRALGAVTLGTFVFSALAAAIGALFTGAPFIMVMGYLLLAEGLFTAIPSSIPVFGMFKIFAMSWHLRNFAGIAVMTTAANPLPMPEVQLNVAPWISLLVVVAIGLVSLLGVALAANESEY